MTTIRHQENQITFSSLSRKICLVLIWIAVLYSVIIQYKYIEISNLMLILGVLVLVTYCLSYIGQPFSIKTLLTNEDAWMIAFMIYLLPVGMLVSPKPSNHVEQWITSMEYLFLMVVISSIIKQSGTDIIHLLLLITAVLLAIVFINNPVHHSSGGRYSLSKNVNPNSLGISFTAGIWAILYFQQRKKVSILVSFGIIALLSYSIFLTGSRKALISAGIIIILWYFMCFLSKLFNAKSKWRPFFLAFSIFAFFALGIIFLKIYSASDIASRMDELESETTTGNRSYMYQFGLKLFLERPLFGFGFQGFKYYHGLYSHATFIEVPVSGGICGSILYFASYYVSIAKCISLYRRCRKKDEFLTECIQIKMLLVLWAAMLFFCTCIIHPYIFSSFILFGIIFGQTAHIEQRLQIAESQTQNVGEKKCKWIK